MTLKKLPKAEAKRYVLRGIAIVLCVLGLALIFSYAYVSANKADIIKSVTQSLSEKINGTVTVGDVDISFLRNFPTVAVLLNDVRITDSMISQHQHPFLQAKKVYAGISVWRLIKKQPPVKNIKLIDASVYLFTDTTGYSNAYLVKGKGKSTPEQEKDKTKNTLNKVELKNVRLTLEDKRKEKLHDIQVHDLEVELKDDENETVMNIDASMLVHGLGFNLDRGTYLREQTVSGDFVLHLDQTQNSCGLKTLYSAWQSKELN